MFLLLSLDSAIQGILSWQKFPNFLLAVCHLAFCFQDPKLVIPGAAMCLAQKPPEFAGRSPRPRELFVFQGQVRASGQIRSQVGPHQAAFPTGSFSRGGPSGNSSPHFPAERRQEMRIFPFRDGGGADSLSPPPSLPTPPQPRHQETQDACPCPKRGPPSPSAGHQVQRVRTHVPAPSVDTTPPAPAPGTKSGD